MSLTIGAVNGLYNTDRVSETANKLEETLNSDLAKADEKKLMEVCKDFESYFTEQMFKAMQKMVPESEEKVSGYTRQMQDYFKGEMVRAVADDSAEGQGLGIAQVLYEQMKRNYGLE